MALTDRIHALATRIAQEITAVADTKAALDHNHEGVYAPATSVPVRPEDFGAVGDGVTDDTDAIVIAFEEASPRGLAVAFKSAVYKVKPFSLPPGASMLMRPGTVLDFTGEGGQTITNLVSINGSTDTAVSIPSDVLPGSYTITLSDVSGFSVDDDIRLFSDDRFDASSTNVPIGEILSIKSISGNTLTLNAPVLGGPYTLAKNPRLSKVNFVKNILIEGGTIKGGPIGLSQVGLRVSYAKNVLIRGTKFIGVTNCQVQLSNTLNAHVTNCYFENAIADTTGYGVSFANATQDSSCTYSTFLNVRHSLSTNNTSNLAESGIPRRITFAHNSVRDSSTALQGSQLGGDAIDTHTAAEDIFILHNTVIGSSGQGINFECRSGRIEGNTVRYTASNGINVHNESDYTGHVVVRDNIVSNVADKGLNIRSGGRGTTKAYDYLEVSNNTVTDTGFEGIFVGGTNVAPTVRHAIIANNTVLRAGSPTTTVGMYLYNITDVVVTGNVITDDLAIPNYKGIRLTVGARAIIEGNAITAMAGNAWGVMVDDNFTNVTFSTNQYTVFNSTRETYIGAGTTHKFVAYTPAAGTDPGYYSGGVSAMDSSGFITITPGVRYVSADTFDRAATGDLYGINGGAPGQVITLTISSEARTVRAMQTTSGMNRLRLNQGLGTFNMTSRLQTLTLLYSPHLNCWVEVARQGTEHQDAIAFSRLPVGTTSTTVAAGDHNHTDNMRVVAHGTNGSTPRPNATAVYWVGSATPANALENDLWIGGV